MEVYLQLDPTGVVNGLYFWAEACAPTIAAASLVCQWSENRHLAELTEIDPDWCIRQLGAVPRHKMHALSLVCECLKEALARVPFNQKPEGV